MTSSEYCAARARWWRDEISVMPPTPPHVVAEAQAAFAAEVAATPEGSDGGVSNAERIAATWARAARRVP